MLLERPDIVCFLGLLSEVPRFDFSFSLAQGGKADRRKFVGNSSTDTNYSTHKFCDFRL